MPIKNWFELSRKELVEAVFSLDKSAIQSGGIPIAVIGERLTTYTKEQPKLDGCEEALTHLEKIIKRK